MYNHGDGYVDPYSLTQAIAKGARAAGATILQDVKVTATTQTAGGGWRVDTNRGGINAKRLVNAAGFWAREVGKMAGVDLPLVPVDHQYCITNSVPQVSTKLNQRVRMSFNDSANNGPAHN